MDIKAKKVGDWYVVTLKRHSAVIKHRSAARAEALAEGYLQRIGRGGGLFGSVAETARRSRRAGRKP
jgi:hypothetical protein